MLGVLRRYWESQYVMSAAGLTVTDLPLLSFFICTDKYFPFPKLIFSINSGLVDIWCIRKRFLQGLPKELLKKVSFIQRWILFQKLHKKIFLMITLNLYFLTVCQAQNIFCIAMAYHTRVDFYLHSLWLSLPKWNFCFLKVIKTYFCTWIGSEEMKTLSCGLLLFVALYLSKNRHTVNQWVFYLQ